MVEMIFIDSVNKCFIFFLLDVVLTLEIRI